MGTLHAGVRLSLERSEEGHLLRGVLLLARRRFRFREHDASVVG